MTDRGRAALRGAGFTLLVGGLGGVAIFLGWAVRTCSP